MSQQELLRAPLTSVTDGYVWELPPLQHVAGIPESSDNWFMSKLKHALTNGAPSTILIGGKRRIGKSYLGLKIVEELVNRAHEMKWAYRDRGLSTEERFPLTKAQFNVEDQLLYSFRTLPRLFRDPELGGLWYGSPILIDEGTVIADALNFNSEAWKTIARIFETGAYRLLPVIMMVPGNVMRIAYQFRQLIDYFIRMRAYGVGMVYESEPSGFTGQWFKFRGWLGYRERWTGRITHRIEPPSPRILRPYLQLKTRKFQILRARTQETIDALGEEGLLGPYDEPDDTKDLRTLPPLGGKHKREIPT